MLKDEYITIIDTSYNCTIIDEGLCDYLKQIMQNSNVLNMTLKGNMFINNIFIEKYSNTEYKQLINIDYINKTRNFIMGIVLLEPGNQECILTVLDRNYVLEKGDMVWFPASWCYPFSEKYGEGAYSLKIVINKFL